MAGDNVLDNPEGTGSTGSTAEASTSAAATPTAGAPAGAPAAAGGAAPAGVAPATPNYPATPAGTPQDPHVSVGKRMLNGILGALGGTNEVQYSRDPESGKLVATAVKSGPGQQWKRIIAGGLTGAAAGASTPPGPGQVGRAAGRGFGAGEQMVERQDARNYDRAKDSAEMQDKTLVRKAQVALYNQELAKSSWEMTRSQTEFQMGVEQNSANMLNLLHSDPSNEDMGTYKSFADFLETHGGNAKQLAQMNTNAELRVIPNVGPDGKMQGVHIIKVNPAWNAQKNTAAVQIDMGPSVGKDGKGQTNMQTIPPNSMTNGEIATLQQASSKRWLDYHKEQSEAADKAADVKQKTAAAAKDYAQAGEARAQTKVLEKAVNDGELGHAAQLLVGGDEDPSQLSKRQKNYQATLNAADDYSMQKYGKHFDIAQATTDYKYAQNKSTQDTLKYLDSLVGHDNKGGNLARLQASSQGLTRTDFPALNDVAAWTRLQTGDPAIARYHTDVVEVADQFAKIMQGGGTGNGTSDFKIKQGVEMFRQGFSKDQLNSVVEEARGLLGNRKKELIGNNRYLLKQFPMMVKFKPSIGDGQPREINASEIDAARKIDPNLQVIE
jgi:hypothetical protein